MIRKPCDPEEMKEYDDSAISMILKSLDHDGNLRVAT